MVGLYENFLRMSSRLSRNDIALLGDEAVPDEIIDKRLTDR
jgi:hypothetical protein